MNSERYNIQVSVESQYIEKESDPEQGRYVFAYTVTIVNQGSVPAKLLTRHWIISDAEGRTQEVRGEGVIGEQPHLQPGEGFRPLPRPRNGTYGHRPGSAEPVC